MRSENQFVKAELNLEEFASRAGIGWSALARPGFDFMSIARDFRFLERSHCRDNLVLFTGADIPNVEFSDDASGNLVVVQAKTRSRPPIVVNAQNSAVVIGPTKKFNSRISISGNENLFFSARDATCNSANFVLGGERNAIVIGEGSMLSFDISVRATDSHAIVDAIKRQVVNEHGSIEIGPYVWVGEEATILKNATIGVGSIVGAKSLVAGSVPRRSLAVGVPARVVRSDVTWTRSSAPSAAEINRRIDLVERFID